MCATSQTSNSLGLTDKNNPCSCAVDSRTAPTISSHGLPGDEVVREHYLVEGMTCSHCVASVTEEVTAIDGVESVSVDLQVGGVSRIMVVSRRPVDEDQVRAAVTEAGYSVIAG